MTGIGTWAEQRDKNKCWFSKDSWRTFGPTGQQSRSLSLLYFSFPFSFLSLYGVLRDLKRDICSSLLANNNAPLVNGLTHRLSTNRNSSVGVAGKYCRFNPHTLDHNSTASWLDLSHVEQSCLLHMYGSLGAGKFNYIWSSCQMSLIV